MADDARLHVEVVSPEQVLYSGEGEMVVCRTADGDIAFLPGHAPFLGALGVAKVRVVLPDGEQAIAVHAGFVEVSNNHVVVLSDVAELPEQIDLPRAQAAKARAEAALVADELDAAAADALQRAELRLDLAGVDSSI
ncbi:MAG TPA: ATP synthase F1 subunit epsilon [Acidimicrobiia bacterium]|nr:ATP synthase F1 subunit epsilon [Acidimicrobiia bacterium]